MPFNGSGLFVRGFNWVTDKINGINITASRMDGDANDFAGGLSNAVTRDGQGKMAAHFTAASDATYDVGSQGVRWRNGYFIGTTSSNDYLQNYGRYLKSAQQTVTNSATPVQDITLFFVPVSVGSYIVEARMIFSTNAAAVAGGIKVGLFATFVNIDHADITAYGSINGATVMTSGSFATTVAGTPSFSFPTASPAGFGSHWLVMKGTINILNTTGSPQIGVHFCQNTATAGGTLSAETPSYLSVTRVT